MPIKRTVNTDLRAIVECLRTAHYSEGEIVDYLKGPFGLTEDDALAAVSGSAGAGGCCAAPADPPVTEGDQRMLSLLSVPGSAPYTAESVASPRVRSRPSD
jgi:hypothetical protein